MRTQTLNPAIIAILVEQIGNLYPGEYGVDHYLALIVQWMTEEWKRVKKLIADIIVDVAAGRQPLLEAQADVWFPSGKQNLIWQSARKLLGDMQKEAKGMINDARRQARIDANPRGLMDWTDISPITVRLSREGLQEVLDALDYQAGFIDDFTKSTRERVVALTRARYGTFTELRNEVSRTFRIDRDNTMGLFKDEVQSLAQRVIDGTLDVDGFVRQMESSIGDYYERLYMQGKRVTSLQDWERQLIRQQVQGQRQYLDNFADYIRNKQALGEELTSRIVWRAGLYAERGSAMFEFGVVGSWPDDVLIDWVMNPAEHCTTCPIYAANSPYTKDTLPGFPGEGFNLSECGVNCKCNLQVSDLYVWKPVEQLPGEIPEPEEHVPPETVASNIRQKILSEFEPLEIEKAYDGYRKATSQYTAYYREYHQRTDPTIRANLLSYYDNMKAAEKELKSLERKAKKIADKTLSVENPLKLAPEFGFSRKKWNQASITKKINNAMKYVDKSLLTDVKIRIEHGGQRAGADRNGRFIRIAHTASEHTIAHELGHIIENRRPDIHVRLQQFFRERTSSDPTERLYSVTGLNYAYSEVCKKDKFLDPYMGKTYDDDPRELLSMGLHMLSENPLVFAKRDPEYFDLIVQILRGL